jgi:chromosome segregation ATPase
MADPKILEAVQAVRAAAKQFAALAQLGEAADRVLGVVQQEADLSTRVAALKRETAAADTAAQTARAVKVEADAATAVARQAQADAERAMKDAQANKGYVLQAQATEKGIHASAISALKDELELLRARLGTTKTQMQLADAAHAQRMREHTAEHAAIIAQTQDLKDKFESLKAQITPLLA